MVFDIQNRAKPIIKWAGGKSSLLSQFQAYFPDKCTRYIEPFIGGGAVFLALKQNTKAVINDSNEEIINLYKIAREQPHQLMNELDKLTQEYSEEFYYELRSKNVTHPVEKAARTIFLNKTGFNGLYRQNSKGKFNVPFGKRLKCPELYEYSNLIAVAERLKKTKITNLDFEELLEEAQKGDLVYCDPPYEPLSRTSSFNAYQANAFSQSEQIRLKNACLRASERGAKVFISNSTADFILNLYKEFDLKRVSVKRAINSKGERRGKIDEILVSLPLKDVSNLCLIQ